MRKNRSRQLENEHHSCRRKTLAQEIVAALGSVPSDVQLIVAPPFTHLVTVAEVIKGTPIALAAQNCADQPKGAYTGEVAVSMLKDAGCAILSLATRREGNIMVRPQKS